MKKDYYIIEYRGNDFNITLNSNYTLKEALQEITDYRQLYEIIDITSYCCLNFYEVIVINRFTGEIVLSKAMATNFFTVVSNELEEA